MKLELSGSGGDTVKLGSSQQAVVDWLKANGPATSKAVGAVVYDQASYYGKKQFVGVADQAKTAWAGNILRSLVKQIQWQRGDVPEEKVYKSKVRVPNDDEDLGKSHYMASDSGTLTHKTCPACSKARGEFVWKPIKEFDHRIMPGNKIVPQAQCRACRNVKGK